MRFSPNTYCGLSLIQYFILLNVQGETAKSFDNSATIPVIITLTIGVCIVGATEVEDDDVSQLSLSRQAPYYNAELYKVLRQHYKFQDALWAGSGEGPVSSENQDGLAWEDDFQSSEKGQIKITKTMVLYKTVLSTIYPIAMTPVIVTSKISPTVATSIERSITLGSDLSSPTFISITPTATFSSIVVQPTAGPTPISPTEEETNSEGINDKLSAFSTDPRYWIQTSIKRKRDGHHPNDISFHELLQNRLASIYAMAFKRQLLKSLRLMGQQKTGSGLNETIKFDTKRGRRAVALFNNFDYYDEVETNPLYFYLKGQSATARTAMNVSVSMISVNWSDPHPQVDLRYIVYAEATPVQGFVAVKELQVITKAEMESKLGYEIINKAEALVQPLERNEIGEVASTTPWLIALMTLVCVMILILIFTLFMAWKWRHNRLQDRHDQLPVLSERPQDNQNTPPSAQRMLASGHENYSEDSQRSFNSPSSSVFRVGQGRDITGAAGEHRKSQHLRQDSEVSESTQSTYNKGSPDEKNSTNMLINPSEGSSYHSHSPQRRFKSKTSGVAKKVNKRRRSRPRKSHEDTQQVDFKSPSKRASHLEDGPNENEDFSFTGDICRNTDKISFRNLDIYPDSEARTPSAQAKKILSRPSSHELKMPRSSETRVNKIQEKDREPSEKSFDASESEETDKKDAEVQTPTRLKTRPSPRFRTSPRHRNAKERKSKMSLLSTESEDTVEFKNLPLSPDGVNPIGRIRKRFHQFLDDAFNVMATGRRDNSEGGPPQSAKVTVTHEMKRTAPSRRPWTSHIVREESLKRIRPKSSIRMGPPKPAWTVGSERRCQSAKSTTPVINEEGQEEPKDEELFMTPTMKIQEVSSSRSSSTIRTEGQQSVSKAPHSYIFPKYPAFPEMDICVETDPNWTGPGTSTRLHTFRPSDPAVPLIEAIKDEMKRFEKVKVTSTKDEFSKKS